MPQDSLRSIVYRSLVHCDDPNGVVENETIRRSKTSSRKTMMMENNSRRRTRTYSNPSFVENETIRNKVVLERTNEELQTLSPSFQLLKVSRGAQELNQMIDTWSRDMNAHGQSKDIARDLLKGALDLQESLVMLCKLQDASKQMAKLKRKQKLKSKQEVDELGGERVDSNRFGEKSTYELQNPRLSIGGSSRNCTEELKKVIRESLSRQNLLTVSSVEEDVSFNQLKLDSVSDIPSTSSSQSSVVYSNAPVSFDYSVSSIAQRKNAKAPSLIAKLMGLEEFPSKSTQIIPKQADCEKNLNQRKPIFDTERMPKPRKRCYCLDDDEDTERKTLKEIIETMHFKGLLRSNSQAEGHELGSHLSETTWSSDDMPPIVIMKPLRLQHEETEVTPLQESIWDEGPSYCEGNITEQEGRDEPSNQSFAQEEEETMEPKEEIVVKQEPAKKRLARDDNALNTKNISRKLEAKAEPPTKRLLQKNRASTSNQIVKKQELKESKTMEKTATNKMKASSVVQNHKQKTENTNKKVIKTEALPNRRKPVEKSAPAATVSRSQDQVRTTITKTRKVETGSNITRNRMHHQNRTIQNPISKRSEKPVSQNAIDQTKKVRARKVKPVPEAMPDRSKTNRDTLQCKVSNKEIRPLNKLTKASSTTSILLGEQFPAGEQMKSSKIQIEDHNKEEERSVFHKATIQFDQHGSDIESSDIDHKSTFRLNKINLKGLFLSSPSFQNRAEELFDLNINQPKILQTTEIKEIDTVSRRLFLDCANELMEYKSRWSSRVVHPLLRTRVRNLNLQIDLSLEYLVEEICDGVENLKGYCKVVEDDDDAQIQHVDSLFQVLESDLKSQGKMGNGGWELGWMNGFSDNEADQVVGEMEKHVLSELLEEFIIDLLY